MNNKEIAERLAISIVDAISKWENWTDNFTIANALAKDIEEILFAPTVVKVWREDKTIPLPHYAHNGDVGMDIHAKEIEFCNDGLVIVHTGLHFALPKNYEMEISPRSSLSNYTWYIPNTPGKIDEPHRGEIQVRFRNVNSKIDIKSNTYLFPYKKGERIAQLVIRKFETIEWNEVDNLKDLGVTDRAYEGHGSTGND